MTSEGGDLLYSEDGRAYIDFFARAGALNYGHNNDYIKDQVLDYLTSDRIMHGLDMYTMAKREFFKSFSERILEPKKLDYKLQVCGPTGTNAVEAALKLARKAKKRTGIFAFMGGFHGMSIGSLSATSSKSMREGAGLPLGGVTFMPHPSGAFAEMDTLGYIENILTDSHSGIDKPAAKAALEFRDRAALEAQVKQKEEFVRSFFDKEIKPLHPSIAIRGLGLIWGIDVSGFTDEAGAKRMTEISFENGLIIERAGRGDRVLKIMPPLTVSMEHLATGCDIIKSSMQQVISQETQDLLVTT
uniref:aminotransferase class III-fold pyridoxal phosphate-dependent enzyme n=1 Tax=Paenibacillus sp. EKM212P TaxID=1683680 RepID=UPI001EEC0F9E|nr:aminotransferase class III-fold pyridoxal phosphate-dependent enzyme [Paenibacillus sp. EKM212P]